MLAPKTFKLNYPPPAREELDEEESVKKHHQVYGDEFFTWLWKITIFQKKVGIRQLYKRKFT